MKLDLTPIAQTPAAPCMVLFFSATRQWWRDDENGIRVDVPHPCDPEKPYRDERFDLGFWDGETWRWSGTAHEVWQFDYNEGDPNLPTHYVEIEAP